MKHRQGKDRGKIKYQHHMISGLRSALEKIQDWPEIQSIIPAEIRRAKRTHPSLVLQIQYFTKSGIKCLVKSGGLIQEVFFATNDKDALSKHLKSHFSLD